jgi:hypothetical protein
LCDGGRELGELDGRGVRYETAQSVRWQVQDGVRCVLGLRWAHAGAVYCYRKTSVRGSTRVPRVFVYHVWRSYTREAAVSDKQQEIARAMHAERGDRPRDRGAGAGSWTRAIAVLL